MAKFIPYINVGVNVGINNVHQKAIQDLSSDEAKRIFEAFSNVIRSR